MEIKYLSTTALSKELQIPTKDVFKILSEKGLVSRSEDNWILTELGKNKGGVIKTHSRYGSYIAWTESFKDDAIFNTVEEEKNLLTSTALGKHFDISKFRINPILSELGLVQKAVKGWTVTPLGKLVGGIQFEYDKTGIPYVCWKHSILSKSNIINSLKEAKGDSPEEKNTVNETGIKGFREKFEAKHRSADGHYVRSRAEMLIDNWLYMSEIVHAYERKLPVEEDVYCDFYLPVGKVYIEYWGLENDPKYQDRKKEKLKVYEKYGFNLIEIIDSDIQNLDDILPKKLLKFGIQAY
ncbi:glycerol kinase [Niallia taxi]|uniref:Glycerol kinase n=1 Tax=Niallia taxi TaxID=2499688 RepID=A0A3S2U8Q1_9BACI|nr:glycerol kinase [Niallia taxi]RVT59972.1 glycerol kinase [Niallia taxi]